MKTFSVLLFSLLVIDLSAQDIDFSVHFDSDKDVLKPNERTELDTWISANLGKRNERVLLYGHTDHDASDEYNEALSVRRNNTVETYLQSKGFTNIQCMPFGEKSPIDQDLSELAKSKNRRVEIVIVDKDTEKITYNSSYLSQQFTFSSSTGVVAVGNQGTKITIEPNTLVNEDGTPFVGEVNLELREFYRMSDIVSCGLTTTSGSALLETAGMVFVEVKGNGRDLFLLPESTYNIEFAGEKPKEEGFEYFYTNPATENLSWTPVSSTSQDPGITPPAFQGTTEIEYIHSLHARQGPETRNNATVSGVNLKKFGYINCDKFYSEKGPKGDILVKANSSNGEFLLVFEDIKAVLSGEWENGNRVFKNVPFGKKAVLVATTQRGDIEYFAMENVITSKEIINVQLKPTTWDEKVNMLTSLNE